MLKHVKKTLKVFCLEQAYNTTLDVNCMTTITWWIGKKIEVYYVSILIILLIDVILFEGRLKTV
jgi:hypothetical protein